MQTVGLYLRPGSRVKAHANCRLAPTPRKLFKTARKLSRLEEPDNGRRNHSKQDGQERGKRNRVQQRKREGQRGANPRLAPPAAPGDLGSGDQDAKPPRRRGGGSQIVAGARGGRGRGQLKIQLVIQRVQDARGGECTVLWDSGAQVSLVTHQYAEKAGFGR
jgi:hypothetical protein